MKNIYSDVHGACSVTIHLVYSASSVEDIWNSLEAECDNSFFHSWYWISCWLELVLPETEVYLFAFRENNRLNAACFMTLTSQSRRKGLVRITQLHINEYLKKNYNMVIAYNGLLARRGSETKAWASFLKAALRFNSSWDEIALSSLAETDCDIIRNNSKNLDLEVDKVFFQWNKNFQNQHGNADSLLDSFKKKSRKQLRQSIKAFSEIGNIVMVPASSKEQALEYFQEMGKIHTLRWQSVGKSGSFANSFWNQFHRRMIRKYFDDGAILMLKVVCNENILGYLYGHIYRGTVFMHQTGFPLMEDNRLRPGYVSHFEAMLYSLERGFSEYDFLPDAENCYKSFFTDKGEAVCWLTLKRKRFVFVWERALVTMHERILKLKKLKVGD